MQPQVAGRGWGGGGGGDVPAGLHQEEPLSARLRTWSSSTGQQGATEEVRAGECQDPMCFYIQLGE